MKIFTVYVQSNADMVDSARYIQEGFSYKAFFFNVFWLTYHRLWVPASATFLAFALISRLENISIISSTQGFFINLALLLFIGFTGRDFIRMNLEKNGYYLEDLIVASDIDDAEHKFVSSIFNDIKNDIDTVTNEHQRQQQDNPQTEAHS